ncbi:hypothetical protein ES705_26228 [subsurface metagenome]
MYWESPGEKIALRLLFTEKPPADSYGLHRNEV